MGPDTQQVVGDISSQSGIEIKGNMNPEFDEILNPGALEFIGKLHNAFESRRQDLLSDRVSRQNKISQGEMPDFLSETKEIRESDWRVHSAPDDLKDRRVEITGPVDRKMIINALNSGAKVFMADFEDSNCPTWNNILQGQVNLKDAVNREISLITTKKKYSLNEETATLMVRPRGWHLEEKHVLISGKPISGALLDFGLYFFHNAKQLVAKGSGPYFYLPKLESHLEARLWNDIFVMAQDELGILQGTIKATVLIETILAAFEMDEILYELRIHSAGLNCGRWDYIFSFIKKFSANADFVLPERSLVTMDRHFLHSYVELLIKTCHKRGAHAMGGMAAQIPIRNDDEANKIAMQKVKEDKLREREAGHDGTWVAHPGLVSVAMDAFDGIESNQLEVLRSEVNVSAKDLLIPPQGKITEEGFRMNINVGLRYIEAWLRGYGCVPLNNLMEDAATAEISRSQLWQWVHHNASFDSGEYINSEMFESILDEELEKIGSNGSHKFADATKLLKDITLAKDFVDFLTLKAYDYI